MSTPSGAYQLAKVVAARIAERPGATASELYRLYGTGFAKFGCDGSSASAMIAQHLAKFESDGLVISEKKGKERSAPKTWTWVGPAVVPAANEVTAEPAAENTEDEQETDEHISDSDASEQLPPTVSVIPSNFVALDPSNYLDLALISIKQVAAAMARQPIDRRDEKIACLGKLAEITSPDIADLLREIAEDIQ